ncbi:hypothetical protein [Streptomyces sp. Z26]|uniref:hypothetical protein n=1 Tax=Streptomyces sp. Z26 TaxID=2500177 RepID=UPI000EF14BDA|nr:hypothetical protein [Streptomyces sp. Z26]RLL69989.1 hypothetical protein D7M15_27860 [Streptomyces sp. Z26]
MTHTRSRRRSQFRALRREAPSTVAVLAAPADFAAMRAYRSFTFRDHRAYLRRTETLLRALARQGVTTRVTCFDPADYALFCDGARLDPDSPESRSRYVAEIAATGTTVPYAGQRIDDLVPLLTGTQAGRRTWQDVAELLACADTDDRPSTGPPTARGHAAFRRAADALNALLEYAGTGRHHLVCSVHVTGGGPLSAALTVVRTHDGLLRMTDTDALLLCGVLAAGLATGSPGGIVLRTGRVPPSGPPGAGTVRGWSVRDGWLRPLTEAEVFAAYCTDADTGEPVPPEPDVEYAPGYALPRPRPGGGGHR